MYSMGRGHVAVQSLPTAVLRPLFLSLSAATAAEEQRVLREIRLGSPRVGDQPGEAEMGIPGISLRGSADHIWLGDNKHP